MNFLFRVISGVSKKVNRMDHRSISVVKCNQQHFRYGDLVHDRSKGAFYLPIENETEYAFILYKRRNGILELYETVVPEHLRGYGIGHDLAKEVFEYTSANDLKVILSCDFLQRFYKETPFYENVVVDESDKDQEH